ncbi:CYFA0S03e01860g1_1 [Cyberlindnera fabianii]|uniref:CYFA0S03e01860g1_1 n=1 Tax=Cyberlindnera fabianii TaxID=36022 RepID=A0A061AP11_CYBFA|nr:CYFA0S03e01860g1_1 [Cyberlindnera fabianii]
MGTPSDPPPPYMPVDPTTSTSSSAPHNYTTGNPTASDPLRGDGTWRPPPPRPRPQQQIPSSQSLHSQQHPRLPWTYPPGYRCSKCNNTGYKLKNGKSCKSCWEKFARPTNVNYQYVPSYDPGFRIPFTDYRVHDDLTVTNGYSQPPTPMMYMQPPMMGQPYGMMQPTPQYVSPGDPRIGGYMCGRCRGSGRVSFMLLDEELCPVCHGVGRVFG